MAKFLEAKLEGNLEEALDQFAGTRKAENLLFAGASGMSQVMYDEVKKNVSGTHPGQVTGALRDSIYQVYSKDSSNTELKTYQVSWNRKKAPHGHLVEFGTSRMPAYPFIRPALSQLDRAVRAGLEKMQVEFSKS